MSKTIRISFNFDGDSHLKRLLVLPIKDNDSKKIVSDFDCNAKKVLEPLYEQINNKNKDQLLDFIFTLSGTPTEIIVTDDETEEEIYSDDEFNIDPSRSTMSIEQAEENWASDDELDELNEYKNYLIETKPAISSLLIAKGYSKAWTNLINNNVSSSTFIPVALQESLKAAGASVALLNGESEVCQSTLTFLVELEEGEDFDIDKLDFLNVDESYDSYSSVINNLLEDDIIPLNVIIYDGKLHFLGHKQINLGSNEGDEFSDFVNSNMESEKPVIQNEETISSPKYKSPEEWPKEVHDYIRNLINTNDFRYLMIAEKRQLSKIASDFGINPDDVIVFVESQKADKEAKRTFEKRKKELLKNLREEFEKEIKGYKNNSFQKFLLEAKSEYKDDVEVQDVINEIEKYFERERNDKVREDNKDLDDEYYRKQKELEFKQEKIKAEAEAMRIKTQMLKDEAEYKELKEAKDKQDSIEKEKKLEEARKQQEENIKMLKENWPIIKKCLIGLVLFVIVLLILLLLFGPNSQ